MNAISRYLEEYLNPFGRIWNVFSSISLDIGLTQEYIPVGKASHDISNYIKPGIDSEVGIMSYNFPKKEWENKQFLDWLYKNKKKNNVGFKVIGGPEIDAKEVVDKLIKDNIIQFNPILESQTHHIIYCTHPKQLWIEMFHKRGYALSCFYTDNPYEGAWNDYKDRFDSFTGKLEYKFS